MLSFCCHNAREKRQASIYMGKEGILGEAEYHIRRPMPSITAEARPLLGMGADGGPWGRKPPASRPQP